MKKLFTVLITFALVFAACEDLKDNSQEKSSPSLTIRNESSFVLSNVTFSGIPFASSGSDLPISGQSVKQLKKEDINKTGYITFTRQDIGIICRTESITIADEDYTFNFHDNRMVEEIANNNNKNTLSQISFLSKVTVERGGLTVAKNDTENLGETVANTLKQTEFTLTNTGVGKLLLTGTEPVKISDTEGVFSIVQPTNSEIATNGSLTFKINFLPKNIQTYMGTVTVSSNDRDGVFSFTVIANGTAPKPIAGIVYNNNDILQTGTIDAGEMIFTLSKNITVTIINTGTLPLEIETGNITITGPEASSFTKISNPGSTISANGQSSFIIECNPVKLVENNATLLIPTNDTSHNPVIVYLKVTVIQGHSVLQLSQGTTVIANSSLTPFDFGRVSLDSNKPFVFTIKNTGNIALELTGNPVIISSNARFEVQTQPTNKTINPGAEALFLMTYTPTTEKEDYAAITILNDSDDMVFTLNVKGNGYIKRPQITVKQGTATISPNGVYSFGTIVYSATKSDIFTIQNSGEAVLTFTLVNGNCISLEDNTEGHFSVSQQPSVMTLNPGNSTTFSMLFNPSTWDSFNATVKIITDSQYNNEFYFRVIGSGRNYIIGDTGPGGGIIFYDAGSVINSWRFLESSLTDFSAQWGASGVSISTGLSIGDGKQNTQLILAVLNQRGETGRAAQVCVNLNINGFTDWFLPSRDELNLMYQNLRRNGLGNFSGIYWSSSQGINENYTYSHAFSTGSWSSGSSRSTTYSVRAIRAF